jgi:hypothetical protein
MHSQTLSAKQKLLDFSKKNLFMNFNELAWIDSTDNRFFE